MADPVPQDDLAARLQRVEAALTALRPNEDQLAERVLAVLSAKAAEQRQGGPAGLVPLTPARTVYPLPDGPPPPGMTESLPAEPSLRAWFVGSVLSEFRLMARLYLDPRYRLSRLAQFGVPVILGLFVLNYLFFNFSCFVPVLYLLAERAVCIVLAVALYKILAREVVRYRAVLDYLARYGYS